MVRRISGFIHVSDARGDTLVVSLANIAGVGTTSEKRAVITFIKPINQSYGRLDHFTCKESFDQVTQMIDLASTRGGVIYGEPAQEGGVRDGYREQEEVARLVREFQARHFKKNQRDK